MKRKQPKILKTSSVTIGEWAGYLKSPTAKSGRASFSICERTPKGYKTFKSVPLDLINEQYRTGKLSYESARFLAQDIIKQLKSKKGGSALPQNLRDFDLYWEAEYERRTLVDRKSAKNRLLRGIKAIGNLNLRTADRADLQAAVDQLEGNKQRSAVDALNQLLAFIERPERLRKARAEINEIHFVSLEEFLLISEQIKDPMIKLMHEVAFGTGMRAGEIFGILPEHVRGDHVLVATQIDVSGKRRHTKNRKVRKAYILKPYREKTAEWARIPLDVRLAFRKRSISKITRKASAAALGREICFHDLRHSYAVALVSSGKSLALVAQSIGDGILVTERYYSGFVLTPEGIAQLDSSPHI